MAATIDSAELARASELLQRAVLSEEPEGVVQNICAAMEMILPYICEDPADYPPVLEIVRNRLEEALAKRKSQKQ